MHGDWLIFWCVVTGEAEHHALITRSTNFVIGAECNIMTLLA